MATITVSYDNTQCSTGCGDITPAKGSTIQWVNDRTITSFVISNINPATAFSTLPTQKNSWTGILTAGWIGVVTYDIAVVPVNPGLCSTSTERKSPKITVTAPMVATAD